MKRRLKQPIEVILQKTSVPSPDLGFSKAAQKQALSAAVAGRREDRPATSAFRFGRGVVTFAGVGLLVMIGAGTLLAQAGRSGPGHPLYNLNRALERTQLAFERDELAKLDLKLDFMEERLEEATSLKTTDTPLAAEVMNDTRSAVREIDAELDDSRLALATGQAARLSQDQLAQLSSDFRQTLARYEAQLEDLTLAEANGEVVQTALTDIIDVVEAELADPELGPAEFYIELDGQLSDDGLRLVVGEHSLSLAGPLAANPLAGGRVKQVRATGRLSGDELKPDKLKQTPYQLTSDGGQVRLTASGGVLQQEAEGWFVDNGSTRFYLTGELVLDERLPELIGRPVELEGIWQGQDRIVLTKVTGETPSGRVALPSAAGPAAEAEAGTEGEALPATDPPVEPDTPPPGLDR